MQHYYPNTYCHPQVPSFFLPNQASSLTTSEQPLEADLLDFTADEAFAIFTSDMGSPPSLPSPLILQSQVQWRPATDSGRGVDPRLGHLMRNGFSTEGLDMKKITCLGNRPGWSQGRHGMCEDDQAMKVGRYSVEERRERIERYKSKRRRRNFSKKIKYACRKILADNRPRVRGRFIRHEQYRSESAGAQWVADEDEDDENVWSSFLEAFSVNFNPSE